MLSNRWESIAQRISSGLTPTGSKTPSPKRPGGFVMPQMHCSKVEYQWITEKQAFTNLKD
jgi:hypothetical protein